MTRQPQFQTGVQGDNIDLVERILFYIKSVKRDFISPLHLSNNEEDIVLTLLVLGGGQIYPPVVFLHYSKSIGLRLLKFSEFSLIPKALSLCLKPDFYTYCMSPKAHCMNDYFFMEQTKF